VPELEVRGVELRWFERGSGHPVLLLHETAVASAAWLPLAEDLGPHARAIGFDRRAWGASGVPDGYARTTVEEQAEDAAALLEALEATPALVCGAGLGAVVALELLLGRRALVASAVLIEPPLLMLLPEATDQFAADRQLLESAAPDGVEGVVDLYLRGRLLALGPGVERLPDPLTEPARERPRSVLAELGATSAWRRPVSSLSGAERRSLIVTCSGTPPLLRAAADQLDRRLARSERAELDGRGPPQLDSARGLAGLIRGELDHAAAAGDQGTALEQDG